MKTGRILCRCHIFSSFRRSKQHCRYVLLILIGDRAFVTVKKSVPWEVKPVALQQTVVSIVTTMILIHVKLPNLSSTMMILAPTAGAAASSKVYEKKKQTQWRLIVKKRDRIEMQRRVLHIELVSNNPWSLHTTTTQLFTTRRHSNLKIFFIDLPKIYSLDRSERNSKNRISTINLKNLLEWNLISLIASSLLKLWSFYCSTVPCSKRPASKQHHGVCWWS